MIRWILNLFRSFTIVNREGVAYLRRFYLLRTPWLKVYLHEILRSDEDRDLHDHPWDFLSVILRGGYREHLPGGKSRVCPPLSRVYHDAEDAHRVELLTTPEGAERKAWTLVFVGPKRRAWGFVTPIGWVDHCTYLDLKFGSGQWAEEPEFQGMKKFMD